MELKSTLEIPAPYDRLFEHYATFNAVQSQLLDDLLKTDKSIVLQAPTGSGKTVAFELAIVRMLLHATRSEQQATRSTRPAKAVYVAPTKALCAEKFTDWQRRFEQSHIDCQVLQVTGDSDVGDLLLLCGAQQPQLVVTTPEKWHSLTRRWGECEEVVRAVRLLMIDEVHLLGDEWRGPTLEALVTRMKLVATDVTLRVVVASATISNTEDLAAWLGGATAHPLHVTQLTFSNSQRPVPLQRHVIGYSSPLKGFQFDLSLNYKLVDIVRQYAAKRATLVFCNSRKSTEMAAATMTHHSGSIYPQCVERQTQLAQLSQRLHDAKLRKYVICGVAFHHAGLSYDDRQHVEQHFRNGMLMIVMATNTLATGVNLPAHLVVVKSTETYNRGCMEEYAASTILQMIGRAGRPQYDAKGVAVIMTHKRNVARYEQLLSDGSAVDGTDDAAAALSTAVESHLHKHLPEQLNAEIAQRTIDTLATAMNWLRHTFLYVRALRCPLAYGLLGNVSREFVEHKMEEKCRLVIDELHAAGLIVRHVAPSFGGVGGGDVTKLVATPAGKLMAKYALCLETMQQFRQVNGNAHQWQLLNVLAHCREFGEFKLRVNEKATLNALNATPLRYPIAGRIKEQPQKVLVLLQSVLGNVPIAMAGLAQEALRIMRTGERLANCLVEYLHLRCAQPPPTAPPQQPSVSCQRQQQQQQSTTSTSAPTAVAAVTHSQQQQLPFGGDGDVGITSTVTHAVGGGGGGGNNVGCYRALLHAVTIAKCMHARLWENSVYASRQLRKIGNVCAGLFVSAGKCTLQSIAEMDARSIEALLKKSSPFGDELLRHLLETCPHYELQLYLVTATTATQSTQPQPPNATPAPIVHELRIQLAQRNELHVAKDAGVAVLIVGDSANNLLLYQPNVMQLLQQHDDDEHEYELSVPLLRPDVAHITAHIIHTTFVGVDAMAKIVVNAALEAEQQQQQPATTTTTTTTASKRTQPKRKAKPTTLLPPPAGNVKRRRLNRPLSSAAATANDETSLSAVLAALEESGSGSGGGSGGGNASVSPWQQYAAVPRPKLHAGQQQAAAAATATLPIWGHGVDMNESGTSDLIQTKVTTFFAHRKTLPALIAGGSSNNNNKFSDSNNNNNTMNVDCDENRMEMEIEMENEIDMENEPAQEPAATPTTTPTPEMSSKEMATTVEASESTRAAVAIADDTFIAAAYDLTTDNDDDAPHTPPLPGAMRTDVSVNVSSVRCNGALRRSSAPAINARACTDDSVTSAPVVHFVRPLPADVGLRGSCDLLNKTAASAVSTFGLWNQSAVEGALDGDVDEWNEGNDDVEEVEVEERQRQHNGIYATSSTRTSASTNATALLNAIAMEPSLVVTMLTPPKPAPPKPTPPKPAPSKPIAPKPAPPKPAPPKPAPSKPIAPKPAPPKPAPPKPAPPKSTPPPPPPPPPPTTAEEQRLNASDATQKFWYNVCMRFMRLQSYQLHYSNFRAVYRSYCEQCSEQAATSGGNKHSKRAVTATPPLPPPLTHATCQSPATAAVYARRARQQRYRLQLFSPERTATTTTTTTTTTSADSGCATDTEATATARISQINRGIMRHVLTQKLEQQPTASPTLLRRTMHNMTLPSLPKSLDSTQVLLEIETQLMKMEACDEAADNEQRLNFDELCRLYLGNGTQ